MAEEFMTVPALKKWLETKNPETTYDYTDITGCLIFQYLDDMGMKPFSVGPRTWHDQSCAGHPISYQMNQVALARQHDSGELPEGNTFGAALARANIVLQHEMEPA